jgi:hypothetical protein
LSIAFAGGARSSNQHRDKVSPRILEQRYSSIPILSFVAPPRPRAGTQEEQNQRAWTSKRELGVGVLLMVDLC